MLYYGYYKEIKLKQQLVKIAKHFQKNFVNKKNKVNHKMSKIKLLQANQLETVNY